MQLSSAKKKGTSRCFYFVMNCFNSKRIQFSKMIENYKIKVYKTTKINTIIFLKSLVTDIMLYKRHS